jgi:hypothetical protein
MSYERDNPHTFDEAVEFLRAGNHIDYEVKIGRHQGALMTRDEWLESVREHSFIDYDGMGNEIDAEGNILGTEPSVWEGKILVKQGNPGWIKPSQASRIRPDTAYILWYNR